MLDPAFPDNRPVDPNYFVKPGSTPYDKNVYKSNVWGSLPLMSLYLVSTEGDALAQKLKRDVAAWGGHMVSYIPDNTYTVYVNNAILNLYAGVESVVVVSGARKFAPGFALAQSRLDSGTTLECGLLIARHIMSATPEENQHSG